MGNRGDLHAADGTTDAKWKLRRWIACTLEGVKGHRVTFDRPGSYTPLFFVDEAVALAAGHRPCAQCRREAYNRFGASWRLADDVPPSEKLPADEIDRKLHAARIDERGEQVTFRAPLGTLPDGTFATRDCLPHAPVLLWQARLHPWTHTAYLPPLTFSPKEIVTVLTPSPIVGVLRNGYLPTVGLTAT